MPRTPMIAAAIAALALSVGGPAQAAQSCPWGTKVESVVVEGNYVYIDEQAYRAKGFGRNRLERDMRACGVSADAQTHLDKWRRKRRNAWVTGVGGVFLWPVWVLTGVQIHGAVKNRKALETTLEGCRSQREPRTLDM